MHYRFYTVDVFTTRRFGGNQLAVFPHAQGLDDISMNLVARELKISETVFVFPPENPAHTRRLRIFTPATELPFAGHPTIGTAFVLAETGEIPLNSETTLITFEEDVGLVEVTIKKIAGKPHYVFLTAAVQPEFNPAPPAEVIASVLSIHPEDILQEGWEPQAVSCGVPFLFVPLKNLDALGRAHLNRDIWEKTLEGTWAPHLFLFTFETGQEGVDLRARMFAPAMGISEDPATGAAATALAGYLGVRDSKTNGTLYWVVEQGFEMGRPSTLHVEAEKVNGDIIAIRVGGSSVMISEGLINIPTER